MALATLNMCYAVICWKAIWLWFLIFSMLQSYFFYPISYIPYILYPSPFMTHLRGPSMFHLWLVPVSWFQFPGWIPGSPLLSGSYFLSLPVLHK